MGKSNKAHSFQEREFIIISFLNPKNKKTKSEEKIMKPSLVIVISLIMCSLMYSQDSTKHNWALSFGIADNFRLTNFNMDIAVKKIIDDEHQLRLFLSPRVSTNDQERNISGSSQTAENNNINYSLGVGADYLWILLNEENINLFTGTGLIFIYGNGHSKTTSTSTNGDITISENNVPNLNAGIRGTLGVEWKVTEKIGIHSEYLLTGSYNWTKQEQKLSVNSVDNPTVTTKTTGISLGTGVLFGISIYL